MITFLKSFVFAFAGILEMIRNERNFKIQSAILVAVCLAGIYFKITQTEWLIIGSLSGLVLSLETMNSAIEKVCDLFTTETDQRIKKIKDIAAGSVLIASLFAAIAGIVIFWKYVF